MAMNFEGFQDLMRRIARSWYQRAAAEVNKLLVVKKRKIVLRYVRMKTMKITC